MDLKDLKNAPDDVVKALIKKLNAEASQASAEARLKKANAVTAEYAAEASLIDLEHVRVRNDAKNQNDWHTRFYRFDAQVTPASSRDCIDQIAEWSRLDGGDGHIKIQFNSPGGSVFDGLALFDEIQHWRRQGVRFTTSTIGMAASMAGILLQAGDVRVMAPESWMLIHKTSFGAMGSYDEVQDRVKMLDRVQKRIVDIFVTRAKEAGVNGTAAKPITPRQLEARWDRKDWWISSDEALELGLVDEVR